MRRVDFGGVFLLDFIYVCATLDGYRAVLCTLRSV